MTACAAKRTSRLPRHRPTAHPRASAPAPRDTPDGAGDRRPDPQPPPPPARVLHRDDRLRREVLQERDLLIRERPHLLAVDRKDAEQHFVLAQRHSERCARAAEIDHGAAGRGAAAVGFPGLQVSDVQDARSVAKGRGDRARRRPERIWVAHPVIGEGSRQALYHPRYEALPIERMQLSEGDLAQVHRLVEDRVEHRREVAGRIVDDLQHLGGRGCWSRASRNSALSAAIRASSSAIAGCGR